MTILESILSFTTASVSSGITWDIIKTGGEKIIHKFKKKFVNNGSFENEEQCYDFFESIASNKPNSKKNPYNDVKSIYEDVFDNPKQNFVDVFKKWIEENAESFKELKSFKNQCVSVKIEHQENNGSGSITNAGIINNY